MRIPWQVEIDKKGYIEDRRPNANMDPYMVTRLITDTVCSALALIVVECTRHGARFAARISWPVDRALVVSTRKAVSRGDSQ